MIFQLLAEIEKLKQAKDKLQNDYQNAVDKINELEKENKQLKEENKELNKVCKLYGQSLYNADLTKMENILTELEEWLETVVECETLHKSGYMTVRGKWGEEVLDKIQELKEKYK